MIIQAAETTDFAEKSTQQDWRENSYIIRLLTV